MRFLLDVSVVIALIDPTHVDGDVAHAWFKSGGRNEWATCPIVQNGALRIMSQPSYRNAPGSPSVVAALLATFFAAPEHQFWPDDISLFTDERIDVARLSSHKRITDSYLLALAVRNGGRFATLDRRLAPEAVTGGREALVVI